MPSISAFRRALAYVPALVLIVGFASPAAKADTTTLFDDTNVAGGCCASVHDFGALYQSFMNINTDYLSGITLKLFGNGNAGSLQVGL
jgi:hypothetical protein